MSREHVLLGVEGGFTQADHGRASRLRTLARGDWLVFYSPRTALRAGEALQQFTALGRIADDAPYQVELTPDFRPWRRRVDFVAAEAAPVRELIGVLEFIADKGRWGYPFRQGLFRIGAADFARIARTMNVRMEEPVLR